MNHRQHFCVIVLFGTLACSAISIAVQQDTEIDLKELQRPPASVSSKPRRNVASPVKPVLPADRVASAVDAGSSTYIVRPGDHLFRILIREYGLSNDAAERLIPEVIRLNGIRNFKGLTVGQQLQIPLLRNPGGTTKGAGTTSQDTITVSSLPLPSVQSPSKAIRPRHVIVNTASACILSHTVIELLGLLQPPVMPPPDSGGFTAGYGPRKLVVACELLPAEAYTYRRLLALHDAELLAFTGDEPPRRVLDELAHRLALTYQPADPAPGDAFPQTYLFQAIEPHDQDLRLTIVAEGM